MHPHRILSLLFLLLLSLALGACASHDARPAPEPGAPLPAVTLERGDRVFIKIENGKSMTEDLHSMLTAYLQSERGLNPASDVKEAELMLRLALLVMLKVCKVVRLSPPRLSVLMAKFMLLLKARLLSAQLPLRPLVLPLLKVFPLQDVFQEELLLKMKSLSNLKASKLLILLCAILILQPPAEFPMLSMP